MPLAEKIKKLLLNDYPEIRCIYDKKRNRDLFFIKMRTVATINYNTGTIIIKI